MHRPIMIKLYLNQPFLSLSLSRSLSFSRSLAVKKINRWLDWQDVGMLLMTPLDPSWPLSQVIMWPSPAKCTHQHGRVQTLLYWQHAGHHSHDIRRYSAARTEDFMVYLEDEKRVWMWDRDSLAQTQNAFLFYKSTCIHVGCLTQRQTHTQTNRQTEQRMSKQGGRSALYLYVS